MNLRQSRAAGAALCVAAALAFPAPSASAFSRPEAGMIVNCAAASPSQFQCIFPALSANLVIKYVSAQCVGTPTAWGGGTAGFALQEFQILTVPPTGVSEVSFQIPITNQMSLGQTSGAANPRANTSDLPPSVASAGAPVTIYARAGTRPQALIDFIPPSNVSNLRMQCTVSLSGEYETGD